VCATINEVEGNVQKLRGRRCLYCQINRGFQTREPGNGERREGSERMPRKERLNPYGTLHHITWGRGTA
jgi:hypothetical protein